MDNNNNNNDIYIYGNTFLLFLQLLKYTIPSIFWLEILYFIPPLFISNNIIKYTYLILLMPLIDIGIIYFICNNIVAFGTLCISNKPTAILGEDSVSIFDFFENGYIRIKYKNIKGIRINRFSRDPYIEIDVVHYEIYYIQSSNILTKLINKINKKLCHPKNKSVRLRTIYCTTLTFEEFKKTVIERANKHRKSSVYLNNW